MAPPRKKPRGLFNIFIENFNEGYSDESNEGGRLSPSKTGRRFTEGDLKDPTERLRIQDGEEGEMRIVRWNRKASSWR
jgi:hypothetical protein